MPTFIARAQASTSGTKIDVLPELDPDERHPGDQAVVHHLERVRADVEGLAGQPVGLVVLALDDRRRDRLHLRARAGEERGQALALVRALDELVDLSAEEARS